MMRRLSRRPSRSPGMTGQHGADDGSDQCAGNGKTKLSAAQGVDQGEHVRGAGNNSGIKAKEQPTQGAHQRAAYKV